MTDLENDLRRLAERGPVVDSRFVIRRAMQRASHEPSGGSAERVSGPGTVRVLVNRDPIENRRHAPRFLGLAAAAVLSVAGVAGIFYARSGVSSPPADRPVDAVVPSTVEEPQDVGAVTTSTVVPREDDPSLEAMMFGLLQVPTAEEMVSFFSYNVPQSQVAECMHNAGFEYQEEASPAEQVAADPRFVLSPADFASKYGLGIASQQLGLLPTPGDPNWDYMQSLSKSDQEAFVRWKGSCGGATSERMKDSTALNNAFNEFKARLDADDRSIAAAAAWRACMRTAGYDFDTPIAMMESFYARMNSGIDRDSLEQLFAEEQAVAIANVPCAAAYQAVTRDLAASRYGEFRDLVDAARANLGS